MRDVRSIKINLTQRPPPPTHLIRPIALHADRLRKVERVGEAVDDFFEFGAAVEVSVSSYYPMKAHLVNANPKRERYAERWRNETKQNEELDSPQHLTPHMTQTPIPRMMEGRKARSEEPADVVERRRRVEVSTVGSEASVRC